MDNENNDKKGINRRNFLKTGAFIAGAALLPFPEKIFANTGGKKVSNPKNSLSSRKLGILKVSGIGLGVQKGVHSVWVF